jgi:hypothetical protein
VNRGPSAVYVVGFGLDDPRSIPNRGKKFFYPPNRRNRIWAQPVPIQWAERSGREVDHSPASAAQFTELDNGWSCTSTPPLRLQAQHTGNFAHLRNLLQGYPTRGHICKLNPTIVYVVTYTTYYDFLLVRPEVQPATTFVALFQERLDTHALLIYVLLPFFLLSVVVMATMLWAVRSGDRIPVGGKISASVWTGLGAHPASSTGSLSRE